MLLALLVGLLLAPAMSASAKFTLDDLRQDPHLTPERLMKYFRDFEFRLGSQRQAPKDFLAAKSGDCDDFACLASEVLREKKYTTRLIAVFMDGQTHVVCYVNEAHGYLDYNLRREACALQPAGPELEKVADKVAAYFRTAWRSAAEFTYEGSSARFGQIVFH